MAALVQLLVHIIDPSLCEGFNVEAVTGGPFLTRS
jgi:hypothetical protein